MLISSRFLIIVPVHRAVWGESVQAVAASEEVVALAADHLALGLARLIGEGFLVATDPGQLRDYGEPDGLIVYVRWRRYPDTSVWGMDTEMQVLYGLAHHLHLDTANLDGLPANTHAGS